MLVDSRGGYTPTPSVSRAILVANAGGGARADGVCVTPSHNPPADGGFKYNPPDGGPAGTDITGWIQDRANELLRARACRASAGCRCPSAQAKTYDFLDAYVGSLERCRGPRRDPGRPGSGSAPTRWVGRAWPIGGPSASGTAST